MSGSDASALGKYRLIAELGRGGMAEVYLALASGPAGFNKLVVIKKIRDALAEDPDFLSMFMDEARIAARLNHPNVIQTYEVGGEGRHLFIAMEYLEGQPLNRVINRLGPERGLTAAMHLRILSEALTGLHYAHELADFDGTKLQVVHRDMTPHNVFVSYSGQVKVVDFGIAKALGSSAETRAGVLKGKVAYMSPEQALGDPVDRRADIFSVGVMIWEALAGRRLFRDESDLTVLQKIVTAQIPSPREENPLVPARLEAICMKALANNKEERHATAAELHEELEAALDEMGERPQLRDFGRRVAAEFAEEEAKIKALVEAQASSLRTPNSERNSEVSQPSFRLDFGPLKLPVLDGRASDAGALSEPSARSRLSEADKLAESPASDATSDAGAILDPPVPTTRRKLAQVSPAPAAAPPRWSLWLAGIVAALAVAALLFLIFGQKNETPTEAPSATPSGASVHTLHIESTPPGATVSEAGAPLGKTPLALSLDPAQTGARQFVVSLAGYIPYTIQQGPAREDVRVVVPLLRAEETSSPPGESASAAGRGKPPAGAAHAAPTGHPTAEPSAPLPINMTR